MATNKKNKSGTAELAGKLSAGTAKHLGPNTQLLILGATLTPADVTSKLTQIVTLRAAADAAKANSTAKVLAEKEQLPALRTFMNAYVAYVRTAFGGTPDVLVDFGLAPRKAPAPQSPEARATAAAKRKATRDARHTMGPQQKKKVKGDVTGVTVTPVTAPHVSAPATTTANAGATAATAPSAATAAATPAAAPAPKPAT